MFCFSVMESSFCFANVEFIFYKFTFYKSMFYKSTFYKSTPLHVLQYAGIKACECLLPVDRCRERVVRAAFEKDV